MIEEDRHYSHCYTFERKEKKKMIERKYTKQLMESL